jgi:hypothetical protein
LELGDQGVRRTRPVVGFRGGDVAAVSKLYDRLFEDRQQADYVAFVSFQSGEVAALFPKVAEFLTAVEALIVDEPSA